MQFLCTSQKTILALVLFFACLFILSTGHAENIKKQPQNNWFACVYLGQLTTGDIKKIYEFQAELVPSYMVTLAVGKTFWRYHDYFALEWEGQLAKYFGNYTFECDSEECLKLPPEQRTRRIQDHAEINAALVLRWLEFPWDQYLETSFAVGEGLSYASTTPAVEEDLHLETGGEALETSNLLNYLFFELAFALPGHPQWSLIARLHHRSSVFGLFADAECGSNTIGMGLRYEFR